jgi:trans-aconitate methyltransferase
VSRRQAHRGIVARRLTGFHQDDERETAMTSESGAPPADQSENLTRFTPGRPSPARVYDYVLGGKDNYAADREAAEQVMQVFPEGRELAWANRRFMTRAASYCAGRVDQIVDIGTGIPTSPNVSEVVHRVRPDAVVVGVDNDPVVLAHDRALITGEGVHIMAGDVRRPEQIIESLDGIIDWTRPVALIFVAVMHFVPEQDDPSGILATFRKTLAPGSLVALSHVTRDGVNQKTIDRIETVFGNAPAPLRLRTTEQIRGLFAGTDLLDPGLVHVQHWRPEGDPEPLIDLRVLGGVGELR